MQHTTTESHPRHEQFMSALERANKVRLARADIKRDLRDGKLTPEEVLANPPEVVLDVPLAEFLTWLPGIKTERARKIMRGLVHTETLTVAHTSPRTRDRIVERIRHYQPTPHRPGAYYGAVAA